MATRIAITLMGKHKPIYDQASQSPFALLVGSQVAYGRLELTFVLLCFPTDDCGDYVVVTNARSVAVSGRKAEQKLYRHHTGFPGGLKEIPYNTMMQNKPEEVRPVPATPPHCSSALARAFAGLSPFAPVLLAR
jgi:large subunit ribosomal protein L13